MRILLTGGQGQVGSALGQLGTERNLDLVVLDRTNADITNLVSVADAFDRHILCICYSMRIAVKLCLIVV